MSTADSPRPRRSPPEHLAVLLGVSLVIVGVVLVLAQTLGASVVLPWWPLLVIVPGTLLLAAALSSQPGHGITYLAIPGMVATITGLVLLAQSLSGDWQSWSYAWALIAPTAVGLGLVLAGTREKSRGARTAGGILIGIGVVLFVVAEWVFVRVLGVGGPGLGRWFGLAMPAVIMVLGLLLVVRGLKS